MDWAQLSIIDTTSSEHIIIHITTREDDDDDDDSVAVVRLICHSHSKSLNNERASFFFQLEQQVQP